MSHPFFTPTHHIFQARFGQVKRKLGLSPTIGSTRASNYYGDVSPSLRVPPVTTEASRVSNAGRSVRKPYATYATKTRIAKAKSDRRHDNTFFSDDDGEDDAFRVKEAKPKKSGMASPSIGVRTGVAISDSAENNDDEIAIVGVGAVGVQRTNSSMNPIVIDDEDDEEPPAKIPRLGLALSAQECRVATQLAAPDSEGLFVSASLSNSTDDFLAQDIWKLPEFLGTARGSETSAHGQYAFENGRQPPATFSTPARADEADNHAFPGLNAYDGGHGSGTSIDTPQPSGNIENLFGQADIPDSDDLAATFDTRECVDDDIASGSAGSGDRSTGIDAGHAAIDTEAKADDGEKAEPHGSF